MPLPFVALGLLGSAVLSGAAFLVMRWAAHAVPRTREDAMEGNDEGLSEAHLQQIAEVHRRCSLGLSGDPDPDTRARTHRGELLREVWRLRAQVRQAEDRGQALLFEQAPAAAPHAEEARA